MWRHCRNYSWVSAYEVAGESDIENDIYGGESGKVLMTNEEDRRAASRDQVSELDRIIRAIGCVLLVLQLIHSNPFSPERLNYSGGSLRRSIPGRNALI